MFDENGETKRERKNNPLGNEIFIPVPLLTEKGKMIDVLIESVGTDGARTRSFRLDRAVLWPIELQSQGNKKKGSSRNFDSFYSYSYVSGISEGQGGYTISGYIGELLGRAGFEPA